MYSYIKNSKADGIIEKLIEVEYLEFIEDIRAEEEIEKNVSACGRLENEFRKLKAAYRHDKEMLNTLDKLDSLSREIATEEGYYYYVEGFKRCIKFMKELKEIENK